MHERPRQPQPDPYATVHASAPGAGAAPWGDAAAVEGGRVRAESASWVGWLTASWPYALVLAVGLFVLVPALGKFGFWDPWEPKYAESAREMIERGDYIVPYYRGEVRLTKPILVYWGILAGSAVAGLNELGARLMGVVLAIASMCTAYYAVSTLRGRRAGVFAALVLGTAPQFFFISRQAMPDVYLFTSMGCSLLLFALGLYGPPARRNLHFGLSYAAFALAILAKGPMVAGAIFFPTLGVHAVAMADFSVLNARGVRGRALLHAGTSLVAAVVLFVSSITAYVFGTSSMWWGYVAPQRLFVDDARRAFLGAMNRSHGQAIALVSLAIAFALIAYFAWRGARGQRSVLAMFAGAAGVVSLASLAFDAERQVLMAALLLVALATCVMLRSIARLLRVPAISEATAAWRGPLLKQVVLFTVVTLAVAGPWHVAIFIDQDNGYVTDFLVKHNLNRAVEEVNSSGITDFYLRTMTFAYFPWSALIPVMLAGLVAWSDRDVFRRQGFEVYLVISTLVTFVVFTSSVTKFSHYLAPMLIPMSVLIGITLARMTERDVRWSRLGWLATLMLFLLPALDLIREGAGNLLGTFTVKSRVPDELQPAGYVSLLFAAFAMLLLVNVFLRSKWIVAGLFAVSILFAQHYTQWFIPELSADKSMRRLVESYERYREPGQPLGFHGSLKHGIFFYTGGEVELLSDNAEFFEFMDPVQRAFTVIERTRYLRLNDPFERRFPGHDLYVIDDSHFDYHLVTNLPLPEAGTDTPRRIERFLPTEED